MATGYANVTPDQLSALTKIKEIAIIEEADFKSTIGSLGTKVDDLTTILVDKGLPDPKSSDTVEKTLDDVSIQLDNKGLIKLKDELEIDIAASATRLPVMPIAPLIPGFIGFNLKRRTLLKIAGIAVGTYALLPKPRAYGDVVFTENFTAGSDTDIDNIPSYANWGDFGENVGATNYVNSLTNRCESYYSGTGTSSYITAGGIPSGDQKITADCMSDTTLGYSGLLTRVDIGTPNFYLSFFDNASNLVEIYRYDGGAFTSLASQARGVAYPASCSFSAIGTGATVSLTAIGGATASVTASDASGSRIISGVPGVRINNGPTDTNFAWIDNVSVDDLISAAVFVRRRPIIQ
jgi:hypothetical protein